MKQTLLLAIALVCSLCAGAQSLTPTVIATTGFGYTSADLQVDMTVGETFITTLQTPDIILTQGFHQPEAQQGSDCIDPSLINPDVVCGEIFDPVCGCDGITYPNSCVAQTTAGVTSWTPGECGAAIPGCLSLDACNYNPLATQDDGSCLFIGFPCDDGDPVTVDFVADDCTCQGEIEGCTDVAACNYNPIATLNDFSCLFPNSLCDDGNANTVDDFYNADCVCAGLLLGCIDINACNYNANAGADDGSCFFIGDSCDDNNLGTDTDVVGTDCVCSGTPNGLIPGCTDVDACNYDAAATVDNGSCVQAGQLCDDGNSATILDEITIDCVCEGMLMGCADVLACNFNSEAMIDDGSCYFPGDICDDGNAESQNDMWSADCVCVGDIVGCTALAACNYNPNATLGDFSCVFIGDACEDGNIDTFNDVYGFDCTCAGETLTIPGCTTPTACNYDPGANTDDGSCLFIGEPCDDGDASTIQDVITADCFCEGLLVNIIGCTFPDACNFNPDATIDDGLCLFPGDACDDGDANTIDDVYSVNCECAGTPVSVEELQAAFNLYPNPASTEVMITINGLAPHEVHIFDATGREVMNAQRTSRIDIHALAAGVYTFRVMHEGGVWEQQVIKQN